MKKTTKIFSVIILVVVLLSSSFVIAFGEETTKKTRCCLNIEYAYGSETISDAEAKIYKVADFDKDFKFNCTSKFKEYPVSINDLQTAAQWKYAAQTYASYVEADNIEPIEACYANKNGDLSFESLDAGLYLVVTDSVNKDNYCYDIEPFLVVVPGEHENLQPSVEELNVRPKIFRTLISDNTVTTFKVVKLWKDNGSSSRPSEVKVDIYMNGELYTTEVLSDSNGWTYTWEGPDDGIRWQVVERDVSKDYNVIVSFDNGTFMITNTLNFRPPDVVKPPKTGDSTSFWLPITIMTSAGLIFLIFGWKRKQMQEEYDEI